MTGHSYFTRSKNSKDSFPDQSLSKGKERMTGNSEGNGLTEVIVMDPAIAEQNKLLAQLLQQISEMRAEMQKNQDSLNLAIAAKTHAPDDERPPLHFPPPDSTTDHTIPPQKAPIIGLTTPNFPHATQTRPSVLPSRKRKDISSISSELESKHVKFDNPSHSLSNAYPKAPQNPYPVFPVQSNFQASNYQNIPSTFQAPWPNYQNISPNVQAPWPNYQNIPPSYQTPLLNYQNIPPSYQAPQYPKFQMPVPTFQNPPNHCQMPLSSRNNCNISRPNLVKRTPRAFTPLVESQTQLLERLEAAGMLHPIEGRPANPFGKFYKADQKCAYHSGAMGHTTENCINLKHKIQDLIDQKVVTLQAVTPTANSNPLPLRQQVTSGFVVMIPHQLRFDD